LSQLMTQPQLTVDISTLAHVPGVTYQERFRKHAGLSIHQFCRLAEEEFVVPNFYEYDSQSRTNPPFALYDECMGLEELLNRCQHSRILAIRRQKFFASMFPENFDEKVSKGTDILRGRLSDPLRRGIISSDELTTGCRAQNLEAAYVRLGNNWAYLATFRSEAAANALIDGVQDPHEMIVLLQATSAGIAGPYTAGFGGTLNITEEWLNRIAATPLDIRKFNSLNEVREFSRERDAFSLAALELARRALSRKLPNLGLRQSFEDHEFEEFILLLKERPHLLSQAYDIFTRIGQLKGDEKFLTMDAYLSKMEECEAHIGRVQAFKKLVDDQFPVAATAAVIPLGWALRDSVSRRGLLTVGLGMFAALEMKEVVGNISEADLLSWWPGEHEVKVAGWKREMERPIN
jgi:hypothetical protein